MNIRIGATALAFFAAMMIGCGGDSKTETDSGQGGGTATATTPSDAGTNKPVEKKPVEEKPVVKKDEAPTYGSGITGTWVFDAEQIKEAAKARLADLPEEQRKMAEAMLPMMDAMFAALASMKLEVLANGTYVIDAPTDPMNSPGKTEKKEGTWKRSGDAYEFTDPEGGDETATATLEDGKLALDTGKGGGPMGSKMYFKRQ